ncbi:MAG: hypothetical protein QM758_19245 [Armatimonas sp.]
MQDRRIGSKRKREIAYAITRLLEPERVYSSAEIETLVRLQVRADVLDEPGMAADHIRRCMVENGFVIRNNLTNEVQASETFLREQGAYAANIAYFQEIAALEPERQIFCPSCKQKLRAAVMAKHYRRNHNSEEEQERIQRSYFR